MKHEPIERYTPEQAGRGLPVLIDDLYKRFSTQTVLKGVDLRIEPGEFVAIVGRSGCGKSTLLRLIAGLDEASDGSIRLGSGQARARREDVRMMFQDARLLPWKTVLDNVGLGLGGDWRAAATRALRQVGLESRAGEWPAVLSGGQRQRVALARALVHQPRLLLLDEPLGALDALTRIEMQQLIEDLWRASGFTAILVTHDVAEAVALADRVLLVEDGRVTYDVRVDLPRPRHRGAAEFARIEEDVLERILKQPVRPDAPQPINAGGGRRVQELRWAV